MNQFRRPFSSLPLIQEGLLDTSESMCTKYWLTLVRPKLEYASAVWDPHTKEKTRKIKISDTSQSLLQNCLWPRERAPPPLYTACN